MHPKRVRMTVVTWLGIFPLVYLYAELFNRFCRPHADRSESSVVTALVVRHELCRRPRLTGCSRTGFIPGEP